MGVKMSRKKESAIPNDQLEIFKLKMDHFEEIFDWMSLEDLFSLGQTCNRMKRIVGYYIRTKYAATEFILARDGINCRSRWKADGLSSFFKKILIPELECFERNRKYPYSFSGKREIFIPHMETNRFKSLRKIHLWGVHLSEEGISRIKEILGQLEAVEIWFSHFCCESNEFHENFLQFCTNIKSLCIQDSFRDRETCGRSDTESNIIGVDNSWLLRKYSTLEYLELMVVNPGPINELQTFFEQNPQIKSFATDAQIILANREVFMNVKGKWDFLCVRFGENRGILPMARDLLNKLHERGVFEQLHLFFSKYFEMDDVYANQLHSFNGNTNLTIICGDVNSLSVPISVKYLHLGEHFRVHSWPKALDLINVNTIELAREFTCEGIIQLIFHSPKLKAIVFRALDIDPADNDLEIEKLNKERSKLDNARKITIYAPEKFYLATKWKTNETSLSFVEIKRLYDSPNELKYQTSFGT